jgi:hypothetical protein
MNKHDKALKATEERVRAAEAYKKMREEHAKDGYICYLAYMRIRQQERECK